MAVQDGSEHLLTHLMRSLFGAPSLQVSRAANLDASAPSSPIEIKTVPEAPEAAAEQSEADAGAVGGSPEGMEEAAGAAPAAAAAPVSRD